MMARPESETSFRRRQAELLDQCRHPTGHWEPIDWQAPQQSIPDRIAARAAQHPELLAAYDHETSLTYAGLDRAANQAANAILAARGRGQEIVGLLVGHDVPALAAALGVLRAGKTYVALEPSFPQQRSAHILADAGANMIVAGGPHLAQARELAGAECQVLQIEGFALDDPRAPGVAVPLDAPAMLNYTSGSTGLPKGVLQSHASAIMQAVRRYAYFHVCDADRVASSTSLAWSASIWNLFGPLCLGASVGPFDIRQHTTPELVKWFLETEPTILAGRVTTRQIAGSGLSVEVPSLRVVTMGGDTIHRKDALDSLRIFPNAVVAVGLGLSEVGRVTQLLLDSPQMLDWDILPLGLPMPGLQVRLLAPDDQEVEAGEVGEIVVLGPGLATGYWQRPDLTAASFRAVEALGPEPAYFSGDLGRHTPDGLLHHMGRKDHMVKIRGYQVFTNEIESILRGVAGVEQVCVAAQPLSEGTRRLVAYLVVDHEAFPGVPSLHARFEDLPRHMAPQGYVLLEALPMTEGGRKVDRSRLPVPKRSRLGVSAGYVAPRDPVEEVLGRIWEAVLQIDGLGIHDSFLEVGGDSLDATRIISRVEAVLGLRISLVKFFETPTIAKMAAVIDATLEASRQSPSGLGDGKRRE